MLEIVFRVYFFSFMYIWKFILKVTTVEKVNHTSNGLTRQAIEAKKKGVGEKSTGNLSGKKEESWEGGVCSWEGEHGLLHPFSVCFWESEAQGCLAAGNLVCFLKARTLVVFHNSQEISSLPLGYIAQQVVGPEFSPWRAALLWISVSHRLCLPQPCYLGLDCPPIPDLPEPRYFKKQTSEYSPPW